MSEEIYTKPLIEAVPTASEELEDIKEIIYKVFGTTEFKAIAITKYKIGNVIVRIDKYTIGEEDAEEIEEYYELSRLDNQIIVTLQKINGSFEYAEDGFDIVNVEEMYRTFYHRRNK